MTVTVGVLALQGGFHKHEQKMHELGAKTTQVRYADDLKSIDGLIIPGGESTVILRHLKKESLIEPLQEFATNHSVFGTCAGLILMSKAIEKDGNIDSSMIPFGWLDVSVERNAYGRQIESLETELECQLKGKTKEKCPAVFIRAPIITKVGSDVAILSMYKEDPVLVRQGNFLGASFHPELTSSSAIHSYFLQMIQN